MLKRIFSDYRLIALLVFFHAIMFIGIYWIGQEAKEMGMVEYVRTKVSGKITHQTPIKKEIKSNSTLMTTEEDIIPPDDAYITAASFEPSCENQKGFRLEQVENLDDLLDQVREVHGPFKKKIHFENLTVKKDDQYLIFHVKPSDQNSDTLRIAIFASTGFDAPASLIEKKEVGNEEALADFIDLRGSRPILRKEQSFSLANSHGNFISVVSVQGHVKFLESVGFTCDGLSDAHAQCRCP